MLKRKQSSFLDMLSKSSTTHEEKKKLATAKIDEMLKEFADLIKKDLVPLVIYDLDGVCEAKKLYLLLKHNGFELFNLALEKQNLRLVNYFFKNLSEGQTFVMLHHDNSTAIKSFFNVAKNSVYDDHFQTVILPILKAILSIQPNDKAIELLKSCLNDVILSNKETIERLNSIVSQYKQEPVNSEKKENLGVNDNLSLYFSKPIKKVHFSLEEEQNQNEEESSTDVKKVDVDLVK